MSLFCLLWAPFFYLVKRSVSGENSSGGVWALLLGSVTALINFFLGHMITPGGFGFSRSLYGFVDIVSLPIIIPLVVFALLRLVKALSENAGLADFALLWVIPVAAIRSIMWGSLRDPVLLVAVPVLWTAIAVGVSFFVDCIVNYPRWYVVIPSLLFIPVLPVSAAFSYWAFFSQQTLLGAVFFAAAFIPMAVSMIIGVVRSR
jgi:hypothetical protein